jgi:hypothetical protein
MKPHAAVPTTTLGTGSFQRGEIEQKIGRPQAEERNVSQAIKSTLMAGIAAEPVGPMKVNAQPKAGEESEQNPPQASTRFSFWDLEVHIGCGNRANVSARCRTG